MATTTSAERWMQPRHYHVSASVSQNATANPVDAKPSDVKPAKQQSQPQQSQKNSIVPPTTTTTTSNDQAMTTWERLKYFPTAVKDLYHDAVLYYTISDAVTTGGRNAWRGKLPRRPFMQQQRFLKDAKRVGPITLASCIPIVGYVPMVLAVAMPRQVLTHQFFRDDEVTMYADLEYQEKREHYDAVAKHVLHQLKHFQMQLDGSDAVGPLVSNISEMFQAWKQADCDSTRYFPRKYLVALSEATGLHHAWPERMSQALCFVTPSFFLHQRLHRMVRVVGTDDRLLLLEGEDGLTPAEVREACLARGMPVRLPLPQLRECLSNHLRMMEPVQSLSKSDRERGLFAIHLSIVRQYLKYNQK
jgi:hypothetical protein